MSERHGLTRLGEREFLARIPAGELRIRTTREEIPLEEALDFAARDNPKRRFLFVSRLLGRHLPACPARIRESALRLAEKLHGPRLAGPCLFIGMAETATTLGQAVFRAWQQRGGNGFYIDSTRRRTGGEIAFEFTESHSHAPGHLIHRPSAADDPAGIFASARTLVIVDDEMTTGRTALELAAAYAKWRHASIPVHLATLVRWAPAETPPENMQIHALIEGDFNFVADPEFVPKAVAGPEGTVDVVAPRGSRHGVANPQNVAWHGEVLDGSILVIGIGEFGFPPLRLAEEIESRGARAFVQATTRSPIAFGGAIRHIRAFPALTGEGYPEFLYNVPDEHPYSRVILCCEDALPPADHPIRLIPRIECRQIQPV